MSSQDQPSLELPDFDQPAENLPSEQIEFSVAMREFEPLVRFYLLHYDSPEARFKSKNALASVL